MYAMYLRKSRQDIELEQQKGGDTLSRHFTLLNDLAKKLNIVILDKDIYKEGVVSGETIQDRPVIQQLLKKVEKGYYEGVLVTEISRLSRGNSYDQAIISRTFNISNTKIITLNKTFEPNNDIDEEYFEFDLFMARREYKMINRRMQLGRLESIKEGKVSGRTPFGYDKVKVKNGKGYTLQINDDAKYIQDIFERYLKGEGMTTIATKYNNLGIKSPSNNYWTKTTIQNILSNPTYCGFVTFGKRKQVKEIVNGEIVKNTKWTNNYKLYKGMHQQIIDKEIFDKVQELRNLKPKLKTFTELKNPLAGLVYCSKCGKKMSMKGNEKRNAIVCLGYGCQTISNKMEEVEDAVIEKLKKYLSSYQYIIENYEVEIKKSTSSKEKELKQLNNNLSKYNKMLVKACEMLEEGIYTKELYLTRVKALNKQIEGIKNSISELENKKLDYEVVKYKKLVPKLDKCINQYYTLSIKDRNTLLKSIIDKIIYEKNEKHGDFNLSITFKI